MRKPLQRLTSAALDLEAQEGELRGFEAFPTSVIGIALCTVTVVDHLLTGLETAQLGATALQSALLLAAQLVAIQGIWETGVRPGRIVYGLLAPMLKPTLVSFFLFSFVYHWNDYFWPLVMTTDDAVRTLPLGIALLREQGTGVRWHIVMAGNVLLSAPALAVFAFAQRHLLRAVTSKGI